ncbi:MAG: HAD family phosphatase [Dehalococcoidales bacterium]
MSSAKLEAVIWDMDGVIADTAPYHFKAWQRVFPKRGAKFTIQDFKQHFGQRSDKIIRDTVGGDVSAEEVDAIAAEKEAIFRQEVAQHIKALPGAIELISSLSKNGVRMAIASSAPMENIQLIIRELGIADYFQVIVWGREVAESKPSPLGFLLAAERLEVGPENCAVIEDAVAGVTAAKRAGMKCLAVTNNHTRESLREADLIVDALELVAVNDLAGLFNFTEKVNSHKGA